jgi:hypothetical protein
MREWVCAWVWACVGGGSREFEKLDKKKARERLPKPWGATGVSKGCFTTNPYGDSPGPTYIRPSKARPPGFKPFRGGGPAATVRATTVALSPTARLSERRRTQPTDRKSVV